jgi:biotin transporter BioY
VYYQSSVAALADVVLPVEEFRARVARDVLLIIGFTLFVALMARFSIHLPFTPVPVTGQTFAMLVTGAALGSWRGASSLGLYLVIGMFLPVYAGSADSYLWQAGVGEYVLGFSSGSSGFFWQLASGGYIIGFIAGAWLVGFMCERGLTSSVWILPALLAGNALVYVPGLIQLSLFAPDGKTLAWGLYPFIAGDLIKLFLAAMLMPAAWGLANRLRGDDYDHGPRNSRRDRWL